MSTDLPPRSRSVPQITLSRLTQEELDELDEFLMRELAGDDAMTLDILDGYLHAIAIGPVTLMPQQWLPRIWGSGEIAPPTRNLEQLNRILGLVMRHFNSIVGSLEATPAEVMPVWSTSTHRGREYDEAEGWALGFVEGVNLSRAAWTPLFTSPEGQAMYRPIGLLGEEDYGADQDAETKTPARRGKLALLIPDAVVGIHRFWLPYRLAAHERQTAKRPAPKAGHEPCPCGSGKKFKKCCGAPGRLH